ncbi:hypothetical protein [Alkalicoccus urumqiensis]|uniref:Uncharacterized protein n=1 Tax=Alkalicoccus urumqiensis TaxID=1548213 RepID=A0A2P6MLW8_ALKUR|nr:hypothetical protein [Alkalicoccus urumqiensis]PRO67273.1 hypothetical protein C6I21_01565 [Alkalicoccus urumqiensis]
MSTETTLSSRLEKAQADLFHKRKMMGKRRSSYMIRRAADEAAVLESRIIQLEQRLYEIRLQKS